jgi:hypothetical protein
MNAMKPADKMTRHAVATLGCNESARKISEKLPARHLSTDLDLTLDGMCLDMALPVVSEEASNR